LSGTDRLSCQFDRPNAVGGPKTSFFTCFLVEN
jgi:hypothetical protein